MKTKLAGVAAAGSLALLAAGCGTPPAASSGASTSASGAASSASGAASSSAATSGFKACMVSDSGGFQDQSFNQSGYEGLMSTAKSLGVATATTESKTDADYAPNIASLVSQDCNLIVTVGFLLADATGSAADANKDIKFAIVDSTVDPARSNVEPLEFDTAQAAFLAGYVAAGATKTGTVATYGGQKIPPVTIFMDGFVDGVAYYNQKNGTSVKALGWDKAAQNGSFTGDFEDASKGRNTTQNFIDQGADIVLPVAGPVGAGTLAAAKAANASGKAVKVVWVDSDGYDTNPDYRDIILTSVVKKVGAAVGAVVTSTDKGSFSSQPYVGTLANGGVDLAPYHDLSSAVPQKVQSDVQSLKQQIISGQVKVTSQSTP